MYKGIIINMNTHDAYSDCVNHKDYIGLRKPTILIVIKICITESKAKR